MDCRTSGALRGVWSQSKLWLKHVFAIKIALVKAEILQVIRPTGYGKNLLRKSKHLVYYGL